MKKSIEINFPFEEIDSIAKRESHRKEMHRPIYHTHKWWAQRLGSVFRALVMGATQDEAIDTWASFYKKQEFSGKIVLDPFMGSGTTLGESIKCGCKAIGCDINPVSSFIVNQSLRNVPQADLLQAFKGIELKVEERINRFYKKVHPDTGEMCQVLYYFWVKEVVTPEGDKIPLFNNYVFSRNAYPEKKPQAQIICPNCYSITAARYDTDKLTCKKCRKTFNPQQGPASGDTVKNAKGKKYKIVELLANLTEPPKHRMYAVMVQTSAGSKEYLEVTQGDIELYNEAEIELKKMDAPYPLGKVEPGYNTAQVLRYNYSQWSDFFNDRQRLCLNYLLEAILEIEDVLVREAFVGLFSGTLEFNNMFCSFKGEGTGAVRHMFNNHVLKPEKTPLENSVWGTLRNSGSFCALFKSRLLKAQEYREHPFEVKALDGSKVYCSAPMQAKKVDDFKQLESFNEPSYLVLNGDSSALPLPDNSVDAVITDPPYFDFVHYSELSDFFYAWLKPIFEKTNQDFISENSRREGEVQQREPIAFAQALGNVLAECKRVMKDDAVLAFSFHHSRLDGWLSIYYAIEKAGLSITSVYPVKAEMSTASPKSSNREPINIDAIFVCKKSFTTSSVLVSDTVLWANSQSAYRSLCQRLIAVGRELSEGDKRVIMVSSFLNQCSTAGLSYEQVSEKLAGKDLKDLSDYLPKLEEVPESIAPVNSTSVHSSECEICNSKAKITNNQLLVPVCL